MHQWHGAGYKRDCDPSRVNKDDIIEQKIRLREAKLKRPLQEEELQSIRLEVLISWRQTLIEVQTQRRNDEKKAQLRSAIAVKLGIRTKGAGQRRLKRKENSDALDDKISIGINQLNKDILISTEFLRRSQNCSCNFA